MSRLPSYPPHMSTCPLGPDLHRSQHPLTQTEKLFNSFQRLDGFTGTVLPSGSTRFPSSTPLTNTSILIVSLDLMISFSFSKWKPPPQDPTQTRQQQPRQQVESGKKGKREDGPGAYLTPNRILHPYWVSKKPGISVWLLCHQDILKHRKKLRKYRETNSCLPL